jgi:hypothetical protein
VGNIGCRIGNIGSIDVGRLGIEIGGVDVTDRVRNVAGISNTGDIAPSRGECVS